MKKRIRDLEHARAKTFLREWRDYRDMTQEYVAEILGTTKTTISKIERGVQAYNQDVLEQLARVYGATPGQLLDADPRVTFAASPGTALLSGLTASELDTLKGAIDILRRNAPPET